MILTDTAIWMDFFRGRTPEISITLRALLEKTEVAIHPFVIAELALGSLEDRNTTLARLERLPGVRVAGSGELRAMIEHHRLYSRGIGLTDAHLVASCLLTPGIELWTRDKVLAAVAASLRVRASLPLPPG